jgi:hypothetical protein
MSDPRVGYFTSDFFSLDKYLNQDRTTRYINRFNLVKKDPTAKLSEPVKPLVWTIDPSIPEIYRPAVKDGILRWNKAFEALGFKNAVQVQDVPKDDKDYDHADGRYNVIRLSVAPSSPFGAISLFRTDPFTGEILNSSITLDGNLIADLMQEHMRNQASTKVASGRASQVLLRSPGRTQTDDHFLFSTQEQETRHAAANQMAKFGWSYEDCSHANELSNMAVLSWTALQAAPGMKISKEEYVKKFLADCVSHEMGHCLGLRHNFAGSTNLTTDQLADDNLTNEQGISASVMDYTPPNVQAILRGTGNFYMPTIGPYDVWAIKYGYANFSAKTPLAEKFQLAQIASQSGRPGHAFMTDEDADNWNPYAVRFDSAKDPLHYSERVLLAHKRAQDYAVTHLPKRGESYSKRTEVILNSIARSVREARNASRFLGGVVSNRNFRGDAGEKPTLAPVDAATQRQALALITKGFFAQNSFTLPPAVLDKLSLDENGRSWTAPLRDVLGAQQQNLLALLLSATTTDRIAENVYKSGNKGFGLDEHYGTILGNVFAEVGQNKSIVPLRRDLQRFALNALMVQASAPQNAVNEDVRMIASDSLKRLVKRFDAQTKTGDKLDNMTRMHLRDSRDTIQRFLDRGTMSAR